MAGVNFVAPILVAPSATPATFSASKVQLSSNFHGQKSLGTIKRSFASEVSTPSFEVVALLPLLPYKPSVQNPRVDNFGAGLLTEKPKEFNTEVVLSQSEVDEVIYGAYRQIWGIHQILDEVREVSLESQLRYGEITIRDFIRGLVLSKTFLEQNFYPNSNYYFVEKVVQRVLGRDVYNATEKVAWSVVIGSEGVAAFVDALLGSQEYISNFGEYTVPFQRNRVLSGRPTGEVPFNIKNPRIDQKQRFDGRFKLKPVVNFSTVEQANRADFAVSTKQLYDLPVTTEGFSERAPKVTGGYYGATLPPIPFSFKTQNARVDSLFTTEENDPRYVDQPGPVSEKNEIIYAAYRQIFSEHESLKAYRQVQLESEFRSGRITVKEFIKGLATSVPFLKNNYESNSNYRFAEIIVQRLLGRDVYSELEKVAWSIVICNKGVPGFIDAIQKTDEYKTNFGDNIVPYQISRVLPQRATGETPFRLKTPRYDAYYRDRYAGTIDPKLYTTKSYKKENLGAKNGDPAIYALTAKISFRDAGAGYTPIFNPTIPKDYLSVVPSRTL
eukprot:CAMPEP_0184656282 /NCGR_PEP_ID=MMETSP0308-20130426/16204_1 /TAXON_ID=38269 /ORGANISM="Gloeochaete witrockiana, Strain SAG 46.84" /LENGTH=554 /DNA_ID=CAMNT_0027093325 /DNA_START=68 /DNA_END=1732 /DNA_ORIENTATION=+